MKAHWAPYRFSQLLIIRRRRAYEDQPPHVDLLLLGQEGSTVYNGPLRLTTPYFLSIGLGDYGAGITQQSLRRVVCSPDASVPFLDGQVVTLICTFRPALLTCMM